MYKILRRTKGTRLVREQWTSSSEPEPSVTNSIIQVEIKSAFHYRLNRSIHYWSPNAISILESNRNFSSRIRYLSLPPKQRRLDCPSSRYNPIFGKNVDHLLLTLHRVRFAHVLVAAHIPKRNGNRYDQHRSQENCEQPPFDLDVKIGSGQTISMLDTQIHHQTSNYEKDGNKSRRHPCRQPPFFHPLAIGTIWA